MGLPSRNLLCRLEFGFFWLLLHTLELQGLTHLNKWCNQVMSAMESRDDTWQNFEQTIVWAAGSSRRAFHQATWTTVDQYFPNALGKAYFLNPMCRYSVFPVQLSCTLTGWVLALCVLVFFPFAVSKLSSQKFSFLLISSKPTNIWPLIKIFTVS